jgi:FkbM family methyltransferase
LHLSSCQWCVQRPIAIPFWSVPLVSTAGQLARRTLPKSVLNRLQVWHGETELCLVRTLLGSGSMVDVGANYGVYSLLAARIGRRVVAFEPNPMVAERLTATLARHIEIHQVALSDEAGTAVLYIPLRDGRHITGWSSLDGDTHQGVNRIEVEVVTATLDSFALTEVGLIKIDVEGHEWPLLLGAADTLSRNEPNLIIEIDERRSPGSLQKIADLLTGIGYEGYLVIDRELVPLDKFRVDAHQRPDHLPKWGNPSRDGYISNVIWVSPRHLDTIKTLAIRARLSHLRAVATA